VRIPIGLQSGIKLKSFGDVMKAIAASIVVLAGAHLIASGAQINHNDTSTTVTLLGGGVGIVGLWLLFVAFGKEKND
jgi:hypothetical protein